METTHHSFSQRKISFYFPNKINNNIRTLENPKLWLCIANVWALVWALLLPFFPLLHFFFLIKIIITVIMIIIIIIIDDILGTVFWDTIWHSFPFFHAFVVSNIIFRAWTSRNIWIEQKAYRVLWKELLFLNTMITHVKGRGICFNPEMCLKQKHGTNVIMQG